MDNIKGLGLNTVYAQVRPFGDALYYSDYFPSSYLFTGTEGEIGSQPYDALEIMVQAAHSRGLRIEAWLNPYRVRTSNKALSDDNPAREMLDTGDALRYEVRDMERYVREGAGEENLSMVEDVMELLTAVRTQWGLVYPFEEVR